MSRELRAQYHVARPETVLAGAPSAISLCGELGRLEHMRTIDQAKPGEVLCRRCAKAAANRRVNPGGSLRGRSGAAAVAEEGGRRDAAIDEGGRG